MILLFISSIVLSFGIIFNAIAVRGLHYSLTNETRIINERLSRLEKWYFELPTIVITKKSLKRGLEEIEYKQYYKLEEAQIELFKTLKNICDEGGTDESR